MKYLLTLTVVDEETGVARTARDIPVLKGLDPATRTAALAATLDRLFDHLERPLIAPSTSEVTGS